MITDIWVRFSVLLSLSIPILAHGLSGAYGSSVGIFETPEYSGLSLSVYVMHNLCINIEGPSVMPDACKTSRVIIYVVRIVVSNSEIARYTTNE